jgi:hypothetical protein
MVDTKPENSGYQGGHQAAKLLKRKEMVPKKGLDLPSFGNSFSLTKIAIVIEYTGFANFSIVSIRLTASAVSIYLRDPRTPEPITCSKLWTPRPELSPRRNECNRANQHCCRVRILCEIKIELLRDLDRLVH